MTTTLYAVKSGYYYDRQLRAVYTDPAAALRAAEICNGTIERVPQDPPITAPPEMLGWCVVADSESGQLHAFRADASAPDFGADVVYDKTQHHRSPTFRTLVTYCWAPTLHEAAEIARERFARHEAQR